MLYFLSSFDHPRLRYTLDLVLGQLLGLRYQLILLGEYKPAVHQPLINYSHLILKEGVSIPNAGLLKQKGVNRKKLKIVHGELPFLFYYSVSGTSYDLPFDVFSAVFYLVSDYEKYVSLEVDEHGRYRPDSYPTAELNLAEEPLVHHYVEFLRQLLISKFGKATHQEGGRTFSFEITFDIDFPWKYHHKGLAVSLAGFGKDLLTGSWRRLIERSRSWFTGRDPNDTFNWILRNFHPDYTRFFFLIERTSPNDSRFTWRHPTYRELIRKISDKGFPVGIHPSYETFLNREQIQLEKKQLEEIIEKEVDSSRQHFLRYRLPDTFRHLLESGIRHEYSLCRFTEGGFPQGMAIPFPWYDLEKEEVTDLILHPTIIMDRTLLNYLHFNPEEGKKRIQNLIRSCRKINGHFTLLLHNDAFSESEEWKGWRKTFAEIVEELK